jgi:hypothetical protein
MTVGARSFRVRAFRRQVQAKALGGGFDPGRESCCA